MDELTAAHLDVIAAEVEVLKAQGPRAFLDWTGLDKAIADAKGNDEPNYQADQAEADQADQAEADSQPASTDPAADQSDAPAEADSPPPAGQPAS